MNKIKIFELVNGNWSEGLNFGYTTIGKSFTTKVVCFSPVGCDIADLKVRIEEKNDFIFTKSEDCLITEWKSIVPFKIKNGEMSNPVKIDFLVKSGPVRLDSFKILFEYLEIPTEIE